MKPNVKFQEGKTHAWLEVNGILELFLKTAKDSITEDYGDPAVKLCRDQIGEAYETCPAISGPQMVFFIVETNGEVEVFEAIDGPVIMQGGDAIVFIGPSTVFH